MNPQPSVGSHTQDGTQHGRISHAGCVENLSEEAACSLWISNARPFAEAALETASGLMMTSGSVTRGYSLRSLLAHRWLRLDNSGSVYLRLYSLQTLLPIVNQELKVLKKKASDISNKHVESNFNYAVLLLLFCFIVSANILLGLI